MEKNSIISLGIRLGLVLFLLAAVATIPAWSQNDTIRPAPPVLSLVSVIPNTGFVTLRWTKSPDKDVAGYIIYQGKNNIWIAIDTLYNPNIESFEDYRAHADFFPVSYVIAAIDTAGNPSPLTAEHTTNYLTTLFDACTGNIYLSWTGYKGWGDQLVSYAIYGKEGNNDFKLLDSVSSGVLADTLTQVIPDKDYCFVVKAWHTNGWVSHSNRKCITATMPPPPDYISVDEASVIGNNQVFLKFSIDNTSQLQHYILLRGTTPDRCSDTIMEWEKYTEAELSYTDVPEDSLKAPLYYRLAVLNECGRMVRQSLPATILVPQGYHENFNIYLSWNPCLSYDTLEKYTIYRQTGNHAEELVAELSPRDTSWTEKIESLQYIAGNSGIYCYRIEATGRNHFSWTEQNSFSATICINAGQHVYLPNAFTPNQDGQNDFFVPVFSFAPEKYHLIIRNRWGTIVFESYDYLHAWDGKDKKGSPVQQGVYNYYLYAETPQGVKIRKKGYVMVISK